MDKKVKTGKKSALHRQLLALVHELYDRDVVVEEERISINGINLYLDIYIPKLKIAFEADGIQHNVYTQHFHGTYANFKRQQNNDLLKEEYCKLEDITLVRVNSKEDLTMDFLMQKITEQLDKEQEK